MIRRHFISLFGLLPFLSHLLYSKAIAVAPTDQTKTGLDKLREFVDWAMHEHGGYRLVRSIVLPAAMYDEIVEQVTGKNFMPSKFNFRSIAIERVESIDGIYCTWLHSSCCIVDDSGHPRHVFSIPDAYLSLGSAAKLRLFIAWAKSTKGMCDQNTGVEFVCAENKHYDAAMLEITGKPPSYSTCGQLASGLVIDGIPVHRGGIDNHYPFSCQWSPRSVIAATDQFKSEPISY